MKNIGKKIKELRKENKLTQEQLGKMLNLTQDSISLWEKGKAIPDTQYIVALAIIFKVSTDYLLGLEDEAGMKTENYSTKYHIGTINNNGNIDMK